MSDLTEPDQKIAAAIHHAGWRTGSACSIECLDWHRQRMPQWVRKELDARPDEIWVPFVSSQACDIVHGRLVDEPHAEFILGRLDVPEDAGIALKKSYRRLQLRHPTKQFAEFRVHDRWLVGRADLVGLPRAAELDLTWSDGIDLAKWIGGRYSRYPLPNNLAKRMRYNGGKQREWLKRLSAEVEEIRVLVTPPEHELEEHETYNVVLYVIARRPLSEKAKVAYDSFKAWTSGLKGVTTQVRLETADKFSYATFKSTHRLDLDALTFGYLGGPKGAVPAGE